PAGRPRPAQWPSQPCRHKAGGQRSWPKPARIPKINHMPSLGRNIMNRRGFTTTALLGLALATALPQAGLAQSNPLIGTWKLNLAKSKYSPGPPPRSSTVIWEAVGQGLRARAEGVDAQGNPTKTDSGVVFYDGKSYPTTGNPDYDASSYKQVNASTFEF